MTESIIIRSAQQNKSRSKNYREQCKREGKCVKCGQENDRLPLTQCTICTKKASINNEKYNRNRYALIKIRLTKLESRTLYLEEKVAWLMTQIPK